MKHIIWSRYGNDYLVSSRMLRKRKKDRLKEMITTDCKMCPHLDADSNKPKMNTFVKQSGKKAMLTRK